MTATPSLVRGVVWRGVAVVAVVLVLLNVAVLVLLGQRLDASLDELLRERAAVVRVTAQDVAAEGGDAVELARRLQAEGLRAVVHEPDGDVAVADPVSPGIGRNLPGDGPASRSLSVDAGDGLRVDVFARTEGRSRALRQLAAIQAGGSLAALALAGLLLEQASRRALRPVGKIAEAAARTTGGRVGERLRPDDPTTELGRMATAYDAMLDALEASLAEAREAQRARALVAAVVEGSTDAIVVQDLAGTVLTWNQAAEGMLGWTAEEAIGRHVRLFVPPEELPQLRELVDEVAADGSVRGYEGERCTREKGRLPVAVRLSPVRDDDGRIVAVAVGARDISEQRWMAETLDATLAALQQAADEARESEEAARRFLADAAHQLRTPLAGIRACAETLLRGPSPEDGDRLLATMVRETSRGARLVASLLRMARLDQHLPLAHEPVDVVALCRDEVERLSLLSPDLDVRLDVRRALDAPVIADPAGCQEVLSNLGDNARRHARGRIALVVDAADGRVHVRVEDDGPGVPPDAVERVFERFVSLDGRGGSGLGLPIARALARQMGGDLRYDAGFVLELPLGSRGEGSSTVPRDRTAAT